MTNSHKDECAPSDRRAPAPKEPQAGSTDTGKGKPKKSAREARLAEALRQNLRRRKAPPSDEKQD